MGLEVSCCGGQTRRLERKTSQELVLREKGRDVGEEKKKERIEGRGEENELEKGK